MIEFTLEDWNTIVSIVTRLQTERSGVRITVGASDFLLLWNVQAGPVPHPASCSMATRTGALYTEVKRQGRDASYSPLYSTKVRNE